MSWDTTSLWAERYRKLDNLAEIKQLKEDALTHLSDEQRRNRIAAKAAKPNEEAMAVMHDLNLKTGVLLRGNDELEGQITAAIKERNRQQALYNEARARREMLDRDLEHASRLPYAT